MRTSISKKHNLLLGIICLCVFSSTFLNADIVFLSDRDGSVPTYECEVYTMNDFGGNAQRLTNDLLYKARPKWSPNGRKIVFAVEIVKPRQNDWEQDQTVELFIMDATGKNKRQLTDYKHLSTHPTWSPNGRSIAFMSNHAGGPEIYKMDLSDGNIYQITNNVAEGGVMVQAPDWSPGGDKIVYARSMPRTGTEIYITDISGRNNRPLVKAEKLVKEGVRIHTSPKWHPDNEHILYRNASLTMVQNGNIAVLEIVDHGALEIRKEFDAKPQKLKLPKNLVFKTGCWAENGNSVIFYASLDDDPDANNDIYRYDMLTHNIRNISNHPSKNYSPHWINPTYPVHTRDKLPVQWAQLKQGHHHRTAWPTQ